MKGVLITFVMIILLAINCQSWANKIIITGKPIALIPNGLSYSFPRDAVVNHQMNYVNVSGEERICFIIPHPELTSLDVLPLYIDRDNQQLIWYCYRYDARFFEIDF